MGEVENRTWSEWANEVFKELKDIRKEQNDSFTEMRRIVYDNKENTNNKINDLQKEFIEFKTKVNTRTAIISAVFSVIVSGTALFYTLIQIAQKLG